MGKIFILILLYAAGVGRAVIISNGGRKKAPRRKAKHVAETPKTAGQQSSRLPTKAALRRFALVLVCVAIACHHFFKPVYNMPVSASLVACVSLHVWMLCVSRAMLITYRSFVNRIKIVHEEGGGKDHPPGYSAYECLEGKTHKNTQKT